MAAGDETGRPYLSVPMSPGDLVPRPDPTKLTSDAVDRAKADLREDLNALREILEARLDAMDVATRLLSETVNRTPTAIQVEISHLKELCWERFDSISDQFKARDEKVEALALTQAAALKAALESADKLSEAHTEAALLANAKTEAAFSEQIKALEDKIEVNTRAIDRGEASVSGAQGYRTERRLDYGSVIGALAALIALAAVFVVAFKK